MARKEIVLTLMMGGVLAAAASLVFAVFGSWAEAYMLMSGGYSARCAAGLIGE